MSPPSLFQNEIERAVSEIIARYHAGRSPLPDPLLQATSDACARAVFQHALEHSRGNKRAAAKIIGVDRNTLHKHAKRLGVRTKRPRVSKASAGKQNGFTGGSAGSRSPSTRR